MCNYNVNCTNNFQVKPAGFGVAEGKYAILTPLNNYIFVNNTCSYLASYPNNATYNDTLTLKPNRLVYAKLYYMIGYNYTDAGIVSKGWATVNTKYIANYP